MAAVQSHGFVFEDRIRKARTGLTAGQVGGGYTDIHDIPKGYYNTRYVENNISCKTTKNNSVGCGDICRFFETSMEDTLEVVVGVYSQSPTTKTFHTYYVFKIGRDNSDILWGGIPQSVIKNFSTYVKSIPFGKEGQQANKKEWKSRRNVIYEQHGRGCISIDAKIDSKNQRRVQCSFKIKDLIASGIQYEKYTGVYEGIPVVFDYESACRTCQ
jgi:hypothetical protein